MLHDRSSELVSADLVKVDLGTGQVQGGHLMVVLAGLHQGVDVSSISQSEVVDHGVLDVVAVFLDSGVGVGIKVGFNLVMELSISQLKDREPVILKLFSLSIVLVLDNGTVSSIEREHQVQILRVHLNWEISGLSWQSCFSHSSYLVREVNTLKRWHSIMLLILVQS